MPEGCGAILLGIGDDDTIGAMAARVWIEQRLPHAQLPDWVARLPHGAVGAYADVTNFLSRCAPHVGLR